MDLILNLFIVAVLFLALVVVAALTIWIVVDIYKEIKR